MTQTTRSITHSYGWQLNRGMVRKSNQDSLAVAKMRQVSEGDEYSIGIYIVADGVAGGPDGDVASKIATDVAMREVFAHADLMITNENYEQEMIKAASLAHQTIRDQQMEESEMGAATTLVMAIVVEKTVYVLNIGDSRAYVLSGDNLRQVTRDHTFVQELLDAGALTQEEADHHPRRNILTQSLGVEKTIDPDIFAEHLNVGDYLVLCSDGLYNLVSEDKIVEVIQKSDSPQSATEELTALANQAGGKDNIAVVVVKIKERN